MFFLNVHQCVICLGDDQCELIGLIYIFEQGTSIYIELSQLSSDQFTLVGCFILPSDMGIVLSQYKDPYEPISKMECQYLEKL